MLTKCTWGAAPFTGVVTANWWGATLVFNGRSPRSPDSVSATPQLAETPGGAHKRTAAAASNTVGGVVLSLPPPPSSKRGGDGLAASLFHSVGHSGLPSSGPHSPAFGGGAAASTTREHSAVLLPHLPHPTDRDGVEYFHRSELIDRGYDFGLRFGSMGSDTDTLHPLWGTTLTLKGLVVAAFFLVSTLFYAWAEQLSWTDAAYCSAGVITAVGQVIVPKSVIGRLFTALLNCLSLGAGMMYVMEVADLRRDAVRRALRQGGLFQAGASMGQEITTLCVGVAAPVLLVARLLQYLESWPSYWEALYFCIITASGLGMGDVEPKRPLSRLVFIAYVFSTMGIMLTLLGTVGNALHEAVRLRVAASFPRMHKAKTRGSDLDIGTNVVSPSALE